MPVQPFHVSVIDPLSPAIERVTTILFRPFTLDKWLIIGFAAWLSRLGRSGNPGAGFRIGQIGRNPNFEFQNAFAEARDWVLNNLSWIIPVAVVIGLVGLVVWLLLTWLSSRGQFLFLHGVAKNRAEVVEPWTRFGQSGDSLFFFRVVLGLITFGLMLPFLFWGFLVFSRFMAVEGPNWSALFRLVPTIAGISSIAVLSILVRKLTLDFVVPIMALRNLRSLSAWRHLLPLMAGAPVEFVLYILFSIVLHIAIGFLVLAVVLATCCCAGCLFALPYVGTVFLLPFLIFRRSYSLYYLAQFGPELDAFNAL